jgi:endonuclease-3
LIEKVMKNTTRLAKILARLEEFYGAQNPLGPTDVYEMLLYCNAGYPSSEARCSKGFDALTEKIGLQPEKILRASDKQLAEVMKSGGIVPELRAKRIKDIAGVVLREYDGDLRALLQLPVREAQRALKKFPTISDYGAERILLLTRTATVAALPSNCIHVPLRLGYGTRKQNWAASYREAQAAVRAELPQDGDEYRRAYLLLKRHGNELCKAARPRCQRCPITAECTYYRKLQE